MAALRTGGRVNCWSESLCLLNIGRPPGCAVSWKQVIRADNAPG